MCSYIPATLLPITVRISQIFIFDKARSIALTSFPVFSPHLHGKVFSNRVKSILSAETYPFRGSWYKTHIQRWYKYLPNLTSAEASCCKSVPWFSSSCSGHIYRIKLTRLSISSSYISNHHKGNVHLQIRSLATKCIKGILLESSYLLKSSSKMESELHSYKLCQLPVLSEYSKTTHIVLIQENSQQDLRTCLNSLMN